MQRREGNDITLADCDICTVEKCHPLAHSKKAKIADMKPPFQQVHRDLMEALLRRLTRVYNCELDKPTRSSSRLVKEEHPESDDGSTCKWLLISSEWLLIFNSIPGGSTPKVMLVPHAKCNFDSLPTPTFSLNHSCVSMLASVAIVVNSPPTNDTPVSGGMPGTAGVFV